MGLSYKLKMHGFGIFVESRSESVGQFHVFGLLLLFVAVVAATVCCCCCMLLYVVVGREFTDSCK